MSNCRNLAGPRDCVIEGMLEVSPWSAPQQVVVSERKILPTLAAAYAFGIARNHPFVDGNKRAALLALITFLGLNGIEFAASNAEAVVMIQGIASGEITEDGLTRWIRDNWPAAVVKAAKKPTAPPAKPRTKTTAKKAAPKARR